MKTAVTNVFDEEKYKYNEIAVYEVSNFLKLLVMGTIFTSTKLNNYYIFNEKVFKIDNNSNVGYDGTYSDVVCRGTIDEHCFQLLNILFEFGSYKKEQITPENLNTFYILQKLETEDGETR